MGATGAMSAVSLGSAAVSAEGQRMQGRFSRQMEEINARRANIQAEDSIKRGANEAVAYGKKIQGFAGSQRAALAASGVEVGFGSAGQAVSQTFELGTEDVERIKTNAFREALGYRTQAANYQSSGILNQAASNSLANETLANGGMKALSYGASAYGTYKAANSSSSSSSVASSQTSRGSRLTPYGG